MGKKKKLSFAEINRHMKELARDEARFVAVRKIIQSLKEKPTKPEPTEKT